MYKQFGTTVKSVGSRNITISNILFQELMETIASSNPDKHSHISGVTEPLLNNHWYFTDMEKEGAETPERKQEFYMSRMHHYLDQISFQQYQVSNFFWCVRMLEEASIKNLL